MEPELEPGLEAAEAPTAPETEPEVDPEQEAFASLMSEYWANQPAEKLFPIVKGKEIEFYEAAINIGIDRICDSTYAQLYGMDSSGGEFETQSIQFAGEDGELLQFRINEFASYGNQTVNMATKNRPSFQCQAVNDDANSLNQIESSDAITTYFYEQTYGEPKERATVEGDVYFGKAWTLLDWDQAGGEEIPDPEFAEQAEPQGGPEQGPEPIEGSPTVQTGEMVLERMFWWQVIHEPYRSEHDGHVWRMTKKRRSRWEMMARYPKFAAVIKDEPPEGDEGFIPPGPKNYRQNEDEVVVRTFYHARTPAMPAGRKVVFVGKQAVNGETGEGVELPIDEIPLVPLMSQEIIGTSFGYAASWDWLAINQMLDQITSDIATNVESFGRPTIMMTETADVDLDSLADGKRVLWLPPGLEVPPTALQVNAVPELSLKLAEYLHNRLQSLSGLNSVARGQPDANIQSGQMAALFNSIAIEFQGARQAALDIHRERVANLQLLFLKKYAQYPQMVAIAGEDERSYLQKFTSKDLTGVRRVVVKTASPMLRSQSGRMQLAEFFMKIPGVVKNPEQIIELVVSGRWKPMYKVTRQSLLRINAENQDLRKGPQVTEQPTGMMGPDGMPEVERFVDEVPVSLFDDDMAHILEHAAVLYAPSAMKNPRIVAAVYAHNQEHIKQLRTKDPVLAEAMGHRLPSQPGPGAGAPPGPGSVPDAPSPPPGLKEMGEENAGIQLPKPAQPPPSPQAVAG